MQKVRAEQERTRTYRAVVHLADSRFVQLATPDLPTVNPGDDPDARHRHVRPAVPDGDVVGPDLQRRATWSISRRASPRRCSSTGAARARTMSPGGKYLLYFDERNGHWFTYRIADGVRVNLTEKLKVRFQQENNTPDLPGPVRRRRLDRRTTSRCCSTTSSTSGRSSPTGRGARMITDGDGRKQELVFRYRSLDPEERDDPDRQADAAVGDQRPDRGDRLLPRGRSRHGGAREDRDARQGVRRRSPRPTKADTVVFTLSRFEEFPDLWVSDTSFRDMKKVSNANPQQAEFVWGKSEIIEYINADGKKLRAILTKPENFDPSKKYPLMVYIYEELTQGPAQLPRAERRHQHQRHALRQQRLRRARARHRLRRRGSRARAPRSASSRPSTRWWRRASSTRSASASRDTRGAATRSRT